MPSLRSGCFACVSFYERMRRCWVPVPRGSDHPASRVTWWRQFRLFLIAANVRLETSGTWQVELFQTPENWRVEAQRRTVCSPTCWILHSSTYVLDNLYWVWNLVKPTDYWCFFKPGPYIYIFWCLSKVLVSVQQIVSVGHHHKAAVAAVWILPTIKVTSIKSVFVSQTTLHLTKS